MTQIDEIQSIQGIAQGLNKAKHNLERREDQTWQNWLTLSKSYSQIGYLANSKYCMIKALKLGYDPKKDKDVEISQ